MTMNLTSLEQTRPLEYYSVRLQLELFFYLSKEASCDTDGTTSVYC